MYFLQIYQLFGQLLFKMNYKLFVYLYVLTTLFGCTTTEKSYSDKDVFRYNEHSDITSLDPAFAKDQRNIWAVHQLYSTLVGLDANLDIAPDLAKRWTISDDGLTYIFHLRDDVYFHDYSILKNRKLAAADVVFSLKRLSDPKLASPGSWTMTYVKSIRALDEYTVQIELKQNFPAFLGILSMKYCSILPEEVKDGLIDFRDNPIGTGPFYFKDWIPKEKLVFRKNPLYFETDSLGHQLPYLEAVAITFLPDKQSEFLQFVQGKLDFINGLDISYKDELLNAKAELRPQYKSKIEMDKIIQLNTEYIGFNLSHPKFSADSKNLRKAINYGIDKEKMIKYLRNGIGTAATQGFVPPSLLGKKEVKGYDYNPALARQYLNLYKSDQNMENPSITLSTNPSYVDLIELIQSDLKKIGINVSIDVMPASTLRQKRSSGDLEAFRASWIADYADAENYLSLFYSKNKSPNGPNYTFFESPTYDSLYINAINTASNKERLKLYAQLDSIVIEEAVVIPLLYDEIIRFKSKSLENFSTNSINMLELKETYKTD